MVVIGFYANWSISLSLLTVILWEVASGYGLEGIFAVESLWPGLVVSALIFLIIQVAKGPVVVANEH